MSDRTPNDLAAKLERSQNAYITMMSDGHNSIIVRSKDDELTECYRLMRAAAVLLRRQGEQLDTLRAAIGDPDELRRIAVSVARDRKVTSAEAERRIGILTALAAAVPRDPEGCACGKPATGTVGGVPTCGDDR